MWRYTRYILVLLVLSCNKEQDSSKNMVSYSIDNGRVKELSFHNNYPNKFVETPLDIFFEAGGDVRFGHASEVSISIYDPNILTAALPYSTDKFFIFLRDNQDTQQYDQVFPYTYSHNPPNPDTYRNGQLILTVTQVKNKRLTGTIKGTIFRSDNGSIPNPNLLDCSFDVDFSN